MPRGVRKGIDLRGPNLGLLLAASPRGAQTQGEPEAEREVDLHPVLMDFVAYRHAKQQALAEELRLTRKQRTFIEELVFDFEGAFNASKAARKAGASPRRAAVTGCEWKKMRKVRVYGTDVAVFVEEFSNLKNSLDSGEFWPLVLAAIFPDDSDAG